MIAYRVTNGIAVDIRFVSDDYQPQSDELNLQGDNLPTQESLSDHTIWSQKTGAEQKQLNFQHIIEAGFDTGLGWKLALDNASRNLISGAAALIVSTVALYEEVGDSTSKAAFLNSNTHIKDSAGVLHKMTVQQAWQMIVAYGQYYQQTWIATS